MLVPTSNPDVTSVVSSVFPVSHGDFSGLRSSPCDAGSRGSILMQVWDPGGGGDFACRGVGVLLWEERGFVLFSLVVLAFLAKTLFLSRPVSR